MSFSLCTAQEKFIEPALDFSMDKPRKWFMAEKGDVLKNLESNVMMDSEKLAMLVQQKGTVDVAAFFKYQPATHAGVIPTIKVNLRYKGNSTFEVFKTSITKSYNNIKEIFSDFTFVTEPTTVLIDGRESLFSVSTYTIETKNGHEKVKVWVYAVPDDENFYQITFMDGEEEDNSKLYKELAKSVKIGK